MAAPNFPGTKPTSRTYECGDTSYSQYNSMSGKQFRILYGNRRVNERLRLQYANIADTEAQKFIDHFAALQGGFKTFALDQDDGYKAGWNGEDTAFEGLTGTSWRYASPPVIAAVRAGKSTVTIELVSVLTAGDS